MFNNPFLKKDPLLEAVRNAQFDGECRRQAEKIVNEEFGVYSRKAVVREHLAAYDAALETTYKELKEGWEGSKEDKAEDKKLAKDHGMTLAQWEKSRADKKHDAKEKKLEERDLSKKDYDGDGKRESEKDEVWGSRFKAARAAGKMEEKKMWEGSPLDPKDPSVQGSGDVTETPPVAKKAPNDPSVQGSGDVTYTSPKTRSGHTTPMQEGTKIVSKGYGKVEVVKGGKKVKTFSDPRDAKIHIGSSEKEANKWQKHRLKEEEQLDEISKDLAHRYAKKSIRRMANVQSHADRAHLDHEYDKAKHFYKKADKRQSGIDNALNKLSGKAKVPANEETQIDELSKKTLGSYVKKASHDARQHGAGYVGSGDVKHLRKGYHRVRGIEKAVDRLAKEETQIDELRRSTLVSYIQKASKAKATPENISKRGKGMELAAKRIEKLEEERKRTASVSDAFMSGRKAKEKTLQTDGQSVTYHGNTIAKHVGDEVHVTTAGYGHSPSTRGHVNGILDRLGSPRLSQRKGQLHHGDNPVDSRDWIKVKKPQKSTFSEDSSFKSAQVTETKRLSLGKSVNEVAMAMPPAITPPSIAGQRMPGIIKRSGTATGKFVNPQTVKANQPAKTGSALVKAGNRLPTPATSNLPAPSVKGAVTATQGASKAGNGFSYSRLGDTPGVNPPHPSEKIGGFGNFKAAGTGALGRGLAIAGRIAGPIAGAAALSKTIGDVATGTEAGRKAGAWVAKNVPGATAVADTMRKAGEAIGIRDKQATPTTPGSMDVSKQPAPTVRTSAAAEKVGISQTPKPAVAPAAGTAKPSSVKQSFSQAYQAARQAASTAKQDPNKAQFTWNKGTYQAASNKSQYVPSSQQFKTNVGTDTQSQASSTATPAVQEPAPSAQTPGTTTASVKNISSNDRFKSLGALGEPSKMSDMKTQAFRKGVDTEKAVAANISPEKTPGTQGTVDPGAVENEKRKANQLKECVQIGSNKYRIV